MNIIVVVRFPSIIIPGKIIVPTVYNPYKVNAPFMPVTYGVSTTVSQSLQRQRAIAMSAGLDQMLRPIDMDHLLLDMMLRSVLEMDKRQIVKRQLEDAMPVRLKLLDISTKQAMN